MKWPHIAQDQTERLCKVFSHSLLISTLAGLFFKGQSRLEHNLDTTILFLFKDVIGVWSLIKVETVCDDKGWIDCTLPNAVEKRAQVSMYMCLTHFESQTFSKSRSKGHLVKEAAIDTSD